MAAFDGGFAAIGDKGWANPGEGTETSEMFLAVSQDGRDWERVPVVDELSGDLGPVKTPKEWERAVEIARLVTITRAKRHDTLTYGEIKWAIHDELQMLVGHSMFADLVAAVNEKSDGVLLSSIIVHQDDGRPGDGFLPYAREMGFDAPLETLQRQVYEHFGTR